MLCKTENRQNWKRFISPHQLNKCRGLKTNPMIFRGPNNVIFYFFFFLNETLTSHRCPTIGASAQECSAFRPILPFLNTTRVNVLSNHLQSKLRLCYGFLYFKNIFTLYLHLYQKDMQMHNAFLFGFDFFIFFFNKQTNLLA